MLSITSLASPANLSRQLTALVAQRAEQWFTASGSPGSGSRAYVVSRARRRVSVIYRLQVIDGGDERRLVAKQYWDWLGQKTPQSQPKRATPPRLFARVDVDDKATFEYATLAAIHEHFRGLGEPRFSTIRPLAVWPEERTIIMEESRSISLASLVERCRLASGDEVTALKNAFRDAGAWLQRYHELSPLPHTRPRHAHRNDFVESVQRIASFLTEAVSYRQLLREAIERVSVLALRELPSQLPVKLSHTDFAPRNVLLGAAGTVAVIDTLGRWQAPLYEDLGYFLTALRTGALQMYSQGCWLPARPLAEFAEAFLGGYFAGAATPRKAVRLFEVQSLLYRWAAALQGSHNSLGLRRLANRWRLVVVNRFLAHYLEGLLRELA